jgi:hypothetical protein
MHVGNLLDKLRRDDDAGLALEALDDIVLFSEITQTGSAFGESPAEYVANAASRFANQASHEDWLQLVSAIERSSDAGKTLLTKVVRWALDRDGGALRQAAPAVD